jgi:hypothetical protein
MRKFIFLLPVFALLVIAGCGAPISKEDYDARHGEGAWDHMEEQSSWDNKRSNSLE